jgi:hypothetical protein
MLIFHKLLSFNYIVYIRECRFARSFLSTRKFALILIRKCQISTRLFTNHKQFHHECFTLIVYILSEMFIFHFDDVLLNKLIWLMSNCKFNTQNTHFYHIYIIHLFWNWPLRSGGGSHALFWQLTAILEIDRSILDTFIAHTYQRNVQLWALHLKISFARF